MPSNLILAKDGDKEASQDQANRPETQLSNSLCMRTRCYCIKGRSPYWVASAAQSS